MPGAVAIMLALSPEQESVQPLVLPHRSDPIEPARKHFVDVTLMAHVENEPVLGRFEDAMQRDGQFDDAEVRAKMPAGLRQDLDQLFANFFGELRQVLFVQRLDVGGRTNPIQHPRRGGCLRRG